MPPMGRMETILPATPPDSVQMFPDSPQTVVFEDLADSSVPMSPNCVRMGTSLDEGTVFEVSPVTPGFLMHPSGTTVQQPVLGRIFAAFTNGGMS